MTVDLEIERGQLYIMALNDHGPLRHLYNSSENIIFVCCMFLTRCKCNLRRKWETADVQSIERHLMDYIRECKVPGKRHCMSCLMSEPIALKCRNWSSMKYYVNNCIVALKTKMSQ